MTTADRPQRPSTTADPSAASADPSAASAAPSAASADPSADGWDESPPRYAVGIDLGTTNCAMAFVDTAAQSWSVQDATIPQWVDFGVRESRLTLPSFHYQPTNEEAAATWLDKPARDIPVAEFSRPKAGCRTTVWIARQSSCPGTGRPTSTNFRPSMRPRRTWNTC